MKRLNNNIEVKMKKVIQIKRILLALLLIIFSSGCIGQPSTKTINNQEIIYTIIKDENRSNETNETIQTVPIVQKKKSYKSSRKDKRDKALQKMRDAIKSFPTNNKIFSKNTKESKLFPFIYSSTDNKIVAPIISFYNLPETFDSENVNISIKIKEQGFGVGSTHIFINGIEIASNRNRALKRKRAGENVKTFNIKLQNGLNEISIYTYDKSNQKKSNKIIHNVVASYYIANKPQLHAIVIGIDEFQDKNFNLQYARADASLFGTTLFKRSKELFSKVNIHYLKKEDETTKDKILDKLRSLQDISANDFFVFYIASHGVVIDNRFYIISSNVSSSDNNTIKESGISETLLKDALKHIPTSNKLILLDSCYSGAINRTLSKELAKSSTKEINLTSITAANSEQTALEGFADGHGIFTYIVTDALDGAADINRDGVIKSMELVHYVNKMVPIEARKYKHIQTPSSFQSGQVFNIAKLKNYRGIIDMQPQYFQPMEIKRMLMYMNSYSVKSLNRVITSNAKNRDNSIIKIQKEAMKVELNRTQKIFKTADKKFKFGKSNFIFNDNSIFLDIKDKIKKHFSFVDKKGRNLIVFDFYSKEKIARVVSKLDTKKVSKIYMADRGDWYRVTLQMKSKHSYEHIISKDGIYIKLKNLKE
ncbi:MAG: caspase family protein [Campylobacterota bacterium]|nr:caspase family protein [Campylobacterota bacterium]